MIKDLLEGEVVPFRPRKEEPHRGKKDPYDTLNGSEEEANTAYQTHLVPLMKQISKQSVLGIRKPRDITRVLQNPNLTPNVENFIKLVKELSTTYHQLNDRLKGGMDIYVSNDYLHDLIDLGDAAIEQEQNRI